MPHKGVFDIINKFTKNFKTEIWMRVSEPYKNEFLNTQKLTVIYSYNLDTPLTQEKSVESLKSNQGGGGFFEIPVYAFDFLKINWWERNAVDEYASDNVILIDDLNKFIKNFQETGECLMIKTLTLPRKKLGAIPGAENLKEALEKNLRHSLGLFKKKNL